MLDVAKDDSSTGLLAEGVRRAREARGWTQPQLAEAAGLTPNAIWLIENGRTHPRRKTIEALVAALGIEERDLYGGAPPADEVNPPGLQQMIDEGMADPPPTKPELAELRELRWRGEPDAVAFLYALQAIRRANRRLPV